MNNRVQHRFTPLDLFRGLTIAAMILVNTPGSWEAFPPLLQHADWHGWRLADLVFPFFLFVAGASIPYSSRFNNEPNGVQWKILLKRVVILFLIGLFLNAFPFYHKSWTEYRLMGILQRIAIAYGLAYVFILLVKPKIQGYIILGILILYHLAFILFNTEDPYGLEDNLARTIDLLIIGPDYMWHGKEIAFDPEGILGCISSACSVWVGYFIARFIRSAQDPEDSIPLVSMIGLILVGIGLIWNMIFPINKYLWTSSYVLFTSGMAVVFLTMLMLIPTRLAKPTLGIFISAGKNPLLLFVSSILWVKILIYIFRFPDGTCPNAYQCIFTKVFEPTFGAQAGSLLFAIANVILFLIIGWFLDKRKIFIRL